MPFLRITAHSFLCSAFTLVLTACSHTGHLQTDALSFRTLITSDNIKRFELSVPPKPVDLMRQMNRRSENGEGDSRSQSQQHYTDTYLKYALEDILDENKFCRDGYLLLGRFAGENQNRLRGECKDNATAAERDKFPNTISKW